jgi:hypothetical protein
VHRLQPTRVVVLVEGRSDRAALEVLTSRRGLGAGVEVRAMGGATNVRRHLHDAVADAATRRVLGLCDEPETAFFVRALVASGADVATTEDLAAHGFHTCRRDLEDELIRALGPERAHRALEEVGLAEAFERFSRQQAWAGRSSHDRLRRFAGVVSGRKSVFARALATAVPDEALPTPMRRLLDQVELACTQAGGPPLAPFAATREA